MNVAVLQQFLRNLIDPLKASSASARTVADLEKVCQGLAAFHEKDVGEFADFLARAQTYEREGQWPKRNPPLAGHLIDEPTIPEYAERLRSFLAREVTADGPISDSVRNELDKLAGRLKLPQVRQLAEVLQVSEPFSKTKQGIEKICLKLTGQRLTGTKTQSRAKPSNKVDAGAIQQHVANLRELADTDELRQALDALADSPRLKDIRALATALGVEGGIRSTLQGLQKIQHHLERSRPQAAPTPPVQAQTSSDAPQMPSRVDAEARSPSVPEPTSPPTASTEKLNRIVEILNDLKAKADLPDGPFDEIEAELNTLENELDKAEAITVAKRIGVVRNVTTRTEALEAIRRKILEYKIARERIAH